MENDDYVMMRKMAHIFIYKNKQNLLHKMENKKKIIMNEEKIILFLLEIYNYLKIDERKASKFYYNFMFQLSIFPFLYRIFKQNNK